MHYTLMKHFKMKEDGFVDFGHSASVLFMGFMTVFGPCVIFLVALPSFAYATVEGGAFWFMLLTAALCLVAYLAALSVLKLVMFTIACYMACREEFIKKMLNESRSSERFDS